MESNQKQLVLAMKKGHPTYCAQSHLFRFQGGSSPRGPHGLVPVGNSSAHDGAALGSVLDSHSSDGTRMPKEREQRTRAIGIATKKEKLSSQKWQNMWFVCLFPIFFLDLQLRLS